MYEDFAPKLARVLTEYCVPVEVGQWAVIHTSIEASPLVDALQEAILKRGGNPSIMIGTPNDDEIFFRHASGDQLDWEEPFFRLVADKADILYNIRAPMNTKSLTGIDPQLLARRQVAARAVLERFNERAASGELRWNITAWPTRAAAQEAEMGYLEYMGFAYSAAALDQDDPVAHWQALRDRQGKLCEWLSDKHYAEVRGPGIDMSFEFTGRTWVNCFGERNFPDGEIYTSPIENSVNGHVAFNLPSVYGGREVNGVQLRFKDGKVVEASADKAEDYLFSQLDADGGSRFLGEFAIGTNKGIQRFTGEILYDEKMGGTVHMALGLGLEQAGGVNKSVVHWDMVHRMVDGGEVYIDDELFYQNGEFVLNL